MHDATPQAAARQAVLRQLSEKLGGSRIHDDGHVQIVSGKTALDHLLSAIRIRPGMLVEWLVAEEGAGAMALAAAMANRAALVNRGWVVLDVTGEFYTPGLTSADLDLARLVLVRPRSAADAAWALEQTLRCPGVALTWAWVDHVSERALRRWKLAVESGGGIGMLFRSARVRREPSWADLRWLVTPRPAPSATVRRWSVELLYGRGCLGGQQWDVELEHATGAVCVDPPVADPTPLRAATGA